MDHLKKSCIMFLVILGGLLLIVLVVLVGVFAFRANSDACQQGFKFQNESQLLQKKLKKSQESFTKMEAQWQSCSNTMRDLNKNLEEVTSIRNSLLIQLQELKEEKNSSKVTSSALPGPQIYSLLLGLGLVTALLP
ncbi:bone marrow stromal antigen 2 [Macrotis lagotis]|uniref:bone marrow stromal antigen 2 n=1 Tax=Macrotis lagotis TaxID=92651 RepID=UPI003D693020